jgi:hypothetical protein
MINLIMANEVREVKKEANRISHRYNHLPLLPSRPGGIQQELVVSACRLQTYEMFIN